LSVGVIVPGELTEEKQKRITDLARMAAGIDDSRGDAIVIQPLDQLGIKAAAPTTAPAQITPDIPPAPVSRGVSVQPVLGWIAVGILAMATVLLAIFRRKPAAPARVPLSSQERQQLLLEIQRTLSEGAPLSEARVKS